MAERSLQKLSPQSKVNLRADKITAVPFVAGTFSRIERLSWTPSDFGMTLVDPQTLFASDPDHSAQMIRQILEGREGPPRSIVEANAAAALWVAGAAATLRGGVAVARQAIESGRAWQLLSDLARQTQSLAGSSS